jgi:hypothetical protein
MPGAAGEWNAASARAWANGVAALPEAPSIHRLPCPLCKVDEPPHPGGEAPPPGEALGTSRTWEAYAGYSRDQRGAGLCSLFGDLALVEVQYAVNNCERLCSGSSAPECAFCPVRPGDDDVVEAGVPRPGLGLVEERTVEVGDVRVHAGWDLDLSEQLVVACGAHGFRQVGAGAEPWGDQGHWRWLDQIGTVPEALAPYRLEYVWRTPGMGLADPHLPGFWWPPRHAQWTDRDRFYGTCPLVHRFGAGDPYTLPFGSPVEAAGSGWCELRSIADFSPLRPGAEEAVVVRARESGLRAVRAEDLLGYLWAGYVVADAMGGEWSTPDDRPGWWECDLRTCAFGGDCGGHIILIVGYEDGGDTLVVRNSHGEAGPMRIRRGACGVGVGDAMSVLFLGDDPLAPTGPAIRSDSVASDCSTPADGRSLSDWLADDADGDGIRNGWDVCLYSPNPALLRTRGLDEPIDPRAVDPGYVLEDPIFEDADAWPDEATEPSDPRSLADDEWDPAWLMRMGCDGCPGFPSADRYTGDDDFWGLACDGCPFSRQERYSEFDALRPTESTDPDDDWIVPPCDGCEGVAADTAAANADPDGDGRGMACDPCTMWWLIDPASPSYRPWVPDVRCGGGISGDTDGDGVVDWCDNCCLERNPWQEDGDGDIPDGDVAAHPDGIGDACEPCRGVPDGELAASWALVDPDGDRVGDWCGPGREGPDNCPGLASTDLRDPDSDGYGNPCDGCPDDPWAHSTADLDGDTTADVCDPCPYGHFGDFSPADRDLDGWPNVCDNCPGQPNPGQQNCDWRWEARYWLEAGFEPIGDACDLDVCTGLPPTADELQLSPLARPGSDDDHSPVVDAWDEVPHPTVPAPDPSLRTIRGPLGEMLVVAGDQMQVTIPTTGFRPFYLPYSFGEHAESLPAMVRRCVCWDAAAGAAVSSVEDCLHPLRGPCPATGRPNWQWSDPGLPAATYYTGWLAAKIDQGRLNYPTPAGTLEDSVAWATMEEPIPQDPDLATPPAATEDYDAQGGPWFDVRRGYAAGEMYPGRRIQWNWREERLPRSLDPDGDGSPEGGAPLFVLWTRPHIVADPPGAATPTSDPTRPAADVWPLVAKVDSRCSTGAVDCDDYDNAYSAGFVGQEDLLPSPSSPGHDRPRRPGIYPVGDWGDVMGFRGLPTFHRVSLPVPSVVGPGDPFEQKFPDYDPAAATQGVLLNQYLFPAGYVEPVGTPTRMAPNEPPIDVSEFALAFATPAAAGPPQSDLTVDRTNPIVTGRFYLFGGRNPDGTLSNRIWLGTSDPEGGSAPGTLSWARVAGNGRQPPGLLGAALLVDLRARSEVSSPPAWQDLKNDVFVLGGITDNGGLNSNLWRLDTATAAWDSVGAPSGDSYGGAWPAVTWHERTGYLYGGWTGLEPIDGLYALDFSARHLTHLDAGSAPTPGPRADASIVVTGDGRTLLLYGGLTPSGWTNDLWRFDLQQRVWRQVAAACTQGECPAPGKALLLPEWWSGRALLVPMEGDAQNQAYWLFDGTTWVAGRRLADDPLANDCDGDGEDDPAMAQVCRAGADWWLPVGAVECDSVLGTSVCDAPVDGASRETTLVHGFHDARFAVGPTGVAYVLKQRHVVPIDLSDPERPQRHPPVRLADWGREVLLQGATLYVATTGGLEAFGLGTPAAPERLWRWPMAGGVDDLALAGTVLVAIQPDGFRMLDVSQPTAPLEVATHRLVRGLPGCWQLDPAPWVRDLVRWFFPDARRVGQFDGQTLVIGDLFDVVAVDVTRDGIIERMYTPTVLPGRVRELRLHHRFAYTDTAGGFGFVVRVGDGDLSLEGIHGLDGWADHAVLTTTAGYRSTWRGIEVAYAP